MQGGPGSDVVPVSIWPAKPNQDYEIVPVKRFFVATGSYSELNAVNVAELGQIVTLDFTTRSETSASTEFNTDYQYTNPVYSS